MTTTRAPIGELAHIRGGGTPAKSQPEFYRGSIPWVTPKDMKSWDISTSQDKITQEAISQSATNLIPESSILIVNRSGILKHTVPVGINRVPVAINQDIKALVCGPKVDANYLARMIKSAERIILGWVRATTADNFPIDNLRDLEIPLPSLSEQRRIAAILDKADAIRRKREQSLALADDLLKSAFVHMVGYKHPDYERWLPHRIEQLTESRKGAMRTGPFGSALRHGEFVDEGVAVLGIDNAVQNKFAWGERRFITDEKYAELERYRVFPGDVIITIMGTTGRSAVVPSDVPLAITTKHLATISCNQSLVLPEVLSFSIHSDPMLIRQIKMANKGAIMDGLNLGIIRQLEIKLPPLRLQEQFVALLKRVRANAERFASKDGSGRDLFSALSQRAFRGEL